MGSFRHLFRWFCEAFYPGQKYWTRVNEWRKQRPALWLRMEDVPCCLNGDVRRRNCSGAHRHLSWGIISLKPRRTNKCSKEWHHKRRSSGSRTTTWNHWLKRQVTEALWCELFYGYVTVWLLKLRWVGSHTGDCVLRSAESPPSQPFSHA